MTININKIIQQPEYGFLSESVYLGDNIMFLTLAGSHAYGTNIEGSDIDIRGCALPRESDLIGLTNFEQFIDGGTDTTVYSFTRLVPLLLNCNPNCIELLGGKPEHYAMVSPAGQMLLDNSRLFLSQRAAASFGGYADQQLTRLKNALARDRLPQAEKEAHILDACQRTLRHLNREYTSLPEGGLTLYTDESAKQNTDVEIFMDVNLKHYPLRDFVSVWRDLESTVKNYGKLNHRNKKKDDIHVNKHMMHLIRLYIICVDLLENERIVTYREAEHDLLMSIRNGAFLDEAGLVRAEFYDLLNEQKARFEYAKEHTNLPEDPDMDKVQDLTMTINRMVLKGGR